MYDVKKTISEILAEKTITNVSFTGCGGSLACFYAPYYFITRESAVLSANYGNANEFSHDTPKNVNEHSIVVCASRRGDTKQTVEAAQKAKALGATVIALQLEKDTPLEAAADYTIQFKDTGADGALYEESKSAYALAIAYEIVHQLEGNDEVYNAMVNAMNSMNKIVPQALVDVIPEAVKFSVDYNNNDIIYTMGSGTAWAAAQQQTICIFMEMQWINSSVIHSDEFFNGPFEITEKDTAYLLLKSTGRTREVDERAIAFLNKFNAHTTIIDGYDYGMKELGEVSEYFDHSFYSELLGVYNHLLADRRQHPLSWRKYMWKFNY
ncbi:MAG: SIS domain-containing protein [Solobacterium sp.]|nr:SIS domain-containing protein [Solobacterium sp.]